MSSFEAFTSLRAKSKLSFEDSISRVSKISLALFITSSGIPASLATSIP